MDKTVKYKVYDNILTTDEQDTLNNIFFDTYFPYYITQSSVDDSTYNEWSDNNTIESQLMIHTFIDNISNEVSSFYQKIEHILIKFYEKTNIKFSSIIRCKLNLYYKVADYNKNNYQCPHVDQNYDHKVLIYYPYTSDGDTFLFNRVEPNNYEVIDRIKPIGGRFLLMDKMFHAGQPPIKNNNRMSLNYNLIGAYK
tara:strand:- start:40 stop:627 length:588 start_codon:yes stop_codon:yes gene_type:complete